MFKFGRFFDSTSQARKDSFDALLFSARYIAYLPTKVTKGICTSVVATLRFTGFLPPIDYSQNKLLNNLAAYLKKTNPDDTKEIRKALEHGHCFGLAACYGAMKHINRLPWWIAALEELAKWDGTHAGLQKQVKLPGVTGEREDKFVTVGSLFEQILNFAVYNQAIFDGGFKPDDLSQNTLLRTDTPDNPALLEIVERTGKFDEKGVEVTNLHKIQHSVSVGGYFDENDLAKLLYADDIRNSVCIINNANHALHVSIADGKWVLYDPNYSHESEKTIHKKFVTREALIKELTSILGHSLSINIAHFDVPNKELAITTRIKEVTRDKKSALMREDGLNLMLREGSLEQTSLLLDRLRFETSGATALYKALLKKNKKGYSNLEAFLTKKIELLPNLFMALKDNPTACTDIKRKLTEKNKNGTLLFHQYKSHFAEIFPFIKDNKNAKRSIINALGAANSEGLSGLSSISFNPENFAMVFNFIKNEPQTCAMLAKTLTMLGHDNWTGLQVIAQNVPDYLPEILQLISKDKSSLATIAKQLGQKTARGFTMLQKIALDASIHLPTLLASLEKNKKTAGYLLTALAAQNDEGWSGLQVIANYSPNSIPAILNILKEEKNAPAQLAKILLLQNKGGWSVLHHLANDASKHLPTLLEFICKDKNTHSDVLAALDLKTSAGKTVRGMLNEKGNTACLEITNRIEAERSPGYRL